MVAARTPSVEESTMGNAVYHLSRLLLPYIVVECDISRDPRLRIVVVGGNLGFLDSTGCQTSLPSDDFVAYTQCDWMLPR